ncbi:hypothetical protein C8R43DRAFT_1120405 [Mycena crocata]|nr:hypothetical protein C8R43DRAFT_1120405 [Mycena crocata]
MASVFALVRLVFTVFIAPSMLPDDRYDNDHSSAGHHRGLSLEASSEPHGGYPQTYANTAQYANAQPGLGYGYGYGNGYGYGHGYDAGAYGVGNNGYAREQGYGGGQQQQFTPGTGAAGVGTARAISSTCRPSVGAVAAMGEPQFMSETRERAGAPLMTPPSPIVSATRSRYQYPCLIAHICICICNPSSSRHNSGRGGARMGTHTLRIVAPI